MVRKHVAVAAKAGGARGLPSPPRKALMKSRRRQKRGAARAKAAVNGDKAAAKPAKPAEKPPLVLWHP